MIVGEQSSSLGRSFPSTSSGELKFIIEGEEQKGLTVGSRADLVISLWKVSLT